jgi:hypothetical protein
MSVHYFSQQVQYFVVSVQHLTKFWIRKNTVMDRTEMKHKNKYIETMFNANTKRKLITQVTNAYVQTRRQQ